MKYKKSVYKTFALITQLGISMLTPILLCTFLGVWIDDTFNTHFFILLVVLGIASGFRNVYYITKNINQDKEDKDKYE